MKVQSKYLDTEIDLITTSGKDGKTIFTHEGLEDCIINRVPNEFKCTYDITIEHAEKGYVVAKCVIKDDCRIAVAIGDADKADIAAIRAFDRAAMSYLGVVIPEKQETNNDASSDEVVSSDAVKQEKKQKSSDSSSDHKKSTKSKPETQNTDVQNSDANETASDPGAIDTIVTSGRYKNDGKTYREIARDHKSYAEWCASQGYPHWQEALDAVYNG